MEADTAYSTGYYHRPEEHQAKIWGVPEPTMPLGKPIMLRMNKHGTNLIREQIQSALERTFACSARRV